MLSKKYWCGIYSFIYTFIVLGDFRDPPHASQKLVQIQKRKSVSIKDLTPLLKQSNCWVSDGLQAGRKFFENMYSSPYFMANYHLFGRKVENCLLGLFDDPDRPRSPDHGEKISKSCVIFITNYLNILISITPIRGVARGRPVGGGQIMPLTLLPAPFT